jgi:hypothetical protein
MNSIYKIVTARNTAFLVGHRKDSTDDSPRITAIEVINSEEPGTWVCKVVVGEKEIVLVSDVVEVWRRPESGGTQ